MRTIYRIEAALTRLVKDKVFLLVAGFYMGMQIASLLQ